MKKLIFITMMSIGFINLTNAQDSGNDRSKLAIGVKVGTNYSNVYDSKGENFVADPKFGLAVGGFVTIPLGELFAIQPEVLFSQKGYKGSGTLLGSSYSYKYTSNYIDVPLFVAFRPISALSIVAGPQFSFLTSDKYNFDGGGSTTSQEQQFDNQNIRKNTLCFVGGVDVNVSMLILGVRAGWDLKNNDGDGNSTTPRYKNMWYQATVGFKF